MVDSDVRTDVMKVAHDVRSRSAFFGRVRELADLEAHWAAGTRIVTLLGAPGMGKTRLALHHVAGQGFFEDAVWFDLSAARDEGDVASTLAQVLGVPSAPGYDRALAAAVERRGRVLLVLDECDAVAHQVGAALSRLHAATVDARFLVTSRQRLGVPGERIVFVASLMTDDDDRDAVALFVDRARVARPSFSLLPADQWHVSSMVRRLDGSPLAIELAAARASVADCATLDARVRDDRFALLRTGDELGPRPSRHRSIGEAIDASWRLLSRDEQRALARCAVFHGPFGIAAAEAVLADLAVDAGGRGALDLLQALVDKSLCTTVTELTDGGARVVHRLLESIRAYAQARLSEWEDERHQALARHAEHHLAPAAGVVVTELLAIHARGLARQDALGRAWALRATSALEAHFSARGPLRAYLVLLDQACDASVGDETLERARVLCIRGRVRHLVSADGAEDDFAEALRLGRLHGDVGLEARALLDSAEALMGSQTAIANARFSQARDLHRRLRAVDGECKALGGLGAVAVHVGDLELARRCFEDGLACARGMHGGTPDPRQEGIHLGNLGALHHLRGHLAEARADYQAAFALARRRGDDRVAAVQLGNLGLIHQEQREIAQARSHLEEALALAARVGDVPRAGVIRGLLGMLAYEDGELASARVHLEEAIRELASTPHGRRDRWLWLFTAGLGGVEALLGRPSEGRTLLETAERGIRALGDPMLSRAWSIHAAAVDVAEARRSLDRVDEDVPGSARPAGDARVLAAFSEAQRRAASAMEPQPASPASDDVRTAWRIVARHLGPVDGGPPLMVGRCARWFRPPGGARVDLSRREVAARLLDALCRARLESPGCALSVRQLVAAGWPGERMLARAGASRVYVALGGLRKLGLGPRLARTAGGYLLDPGLTVLTPLEGDAPLR